MMGNKGNISLAASNGNVYAVWLNNDIIFDRLNFDSSLDMVAPEIVIPSWIKNNAGWWASDQITDSDFVSGLQWLISNGIMSIPPTEQGVASDNVIPSWIKNNAEWWADGLIDNFAFVTGLQWLITNGIMVIG